MRFLGIDPGTATTGYGLIEIEDKNLKVLEWGLIETSKDSSVENRLEKIFKETTDLLKKLSPDVFVFEKIFFATNAKTVIAVGQAQGVMLLAASKSKIKIESYAPGTIKKMITGNGRAKKKEVQQAIRRILGNQVKSKAHQKTHFDNAADALAIALTHAMKGGEINV